MTKAALRFPAVTTEEADYSIDAEEAVLSAILIDSEALNVVQRLLDPSMFSSHRAPILSAMIARAEHGESLDPITVFEELVRTGEASRVGGKDYIGFLVDVVPTAANVEYHAKIVRGKAHQRRIQSINNAANKEIAEGVPVADVLRRQQQALSGLEVEQRETVDAILDFYGDKSAQYLSDLTHNELPWSEARRGLAEGDRGHSEISHATMAEYYGGL